MSGAKIVAGIQPWGLFAAAVAICVWLTGNIVCRTRKRSPVVVTARGNISVCPAGCVRPSATGAPNWRRSRDEHATQWPVLVSQYRSDPHEEGPQPVPGVHAGSPELLLALALELAALALAVLELATVVVVVWTLTLPPPAPPLAPAATKGSPQPLVALAAAPKAALTPRMTRSRPIAPPCGVRSRIAGSVPSRAMAAQRHGEWGTACGASLRAVGCAP